MGALSHDQRACLAVKRGIIALQVLEIPLGSIFYVMSANYSTVICPNALLYRGRSCRMQLQLGCLPPNVAREPNVQIGSSKQLILSSYGYDFRTPIP